VTARVFLQVFADECHHVAGLDRLLEIVVRTGFEGIECQRKFVESRDEDDGEAGLARFHLAQQVDAVHARHANVGQDEVGRPILSRQVGKRRETFAETAALVAFEAQNLGKVVADAFFVVND
jgi:hypothetical protein